MRAVARECTAYFAELGISASAIIPISAYQGANLVARSEDLAWYTGPTLLEAFARFVPRVPAYDGPLRLRVQDVYRRGTRRIVAGRVDSGSFAVGDTVLVSPAGITARVESFESWPEKPKSNARAGESVGFCVDRPLYIERGDIISHENESPERAGAFDVTLFWLDETGPGGRRTFSNPIRADRRPRMDRSDRTRRQHGKPGASRRPEPCRNIPSLKRDCAARRRCRWTSARISCFCEDRTSLRAVWSRASRVPPGRPISIPQQHLVSRHERAVRNGHAGAVIWLTGLSASGKSTLAMAVERRLFARGCFVYVLDGDNVRAGINKDLGFSAEDRAENIRRVAEVAALFADAGAIVVTAFISPFRKDRDAARAAAGSAFHEIYVSADLATCEARDPKGLYRRARSGEVKEFTGVTAPYEAPESPELVVDTSKHSIEECVEQLYAYAYSSTRNAVESLGELSLQKTP